MRKLGTLIMLLAIVLFACQKGNNSSSPGGGTGVDSTKPPPPPPGGPTSGLTITGISPLEAYQGDTITLTGTGFDADITRDTVTIGAIETLSVTPYFKPGGNQLYSASNSGTRIVSATTTQIKFTTDASMNIYASVKQPFALKVSSPGKSLNTNDTVVLKALPKYLGLTSYDPQQVLCYTSFAGDSLTITGNGFYPPLTIQINGKTIDYLTPIPENQNVWAGKATVTGFIGIDFFGTGTPVGNCEQSSTSMTIRIINGDGRICEGSATFFPGPNSKVLFVSLPQSQFEKSKTGAVPLEITGYAMRDLTVQVEGLDLDDNTTFHETLGVYGGDIIGTITTTIDIGALPTPSGSDGAHYKILVKDKNGVILGQGGFDLFK